MAAHALDPNSAETGTNIGRALPSLGRCDEALRWFDKALEIRPNLAEELHRFDDAFALYNRMKARKLNNTRTEWILFHLRLLTGNFEAGWAGQEARLKLPSATYPKFPLPIWLGGGKHRRQDHPDLCGRGARRYNPVRPLRADASRTWGSRRSCRSEPAVSSLVRASRYLAVFFVEGGQLPEIDMHGPMGSLPLAFRTRLDTIPSATSYLSSPAKSRVQTWEDRLGLIPGSGSAWFGPAVQPTPMITTDRFRYERFHASSMSMRPLSACRRTRARVMRRFCGSGMALSI